MHRPTRVVLLNDTSSRYHHGCTRVMRLLRAGLETRGAVITATGKAHTDWTKDDTVVAAIKDADLTVINGEGTLHHGRPAGAKLLELTQMRAQTGKPIALVNALWEENPDEWAPLAAQFDLLQCRDSDSAKALSLATGKQVDWLPDLSLSAPAEVTALPRQGMIVGDSVKSCMRKFLGQIGASRPNATVIPTKTLQQPIWNFGPARALLYRAYFGQWRGPRPAFHMAPTEADYLRALASAELHITGRFHAICLSMLTETPFIAVTSNASKIERLLRDAGLGMDRMITTLDPAKVPQRMPFTDDELARIRAFRAEAIAKSAQLFDRLIALGAGK